MSGAYICFLLVTFILDPFFHLIALLHLFWIIFVIVYMKEIDKTKKNT